MADIQHQVRLVRRVVAECPGRLWAGSEVDQCSYKHHVWMMRIETAPLKDWNPEFRGHLVLL